MGTTGRYPQEVRERAVRMVKELQAEHGSPRAAIDSVAGRIGCTAGSLRRRAGRAGRGHGERWARQCGDDLAAVEKASGVRAAGGRLGRLPLP